MITQMFKCVYHIIKYQIYYLKYSYKVLKDSKKIHIFENQENDILFITHNLRGGTKEFTENYVKQEKEIVVLTLIEYVWPICYKLKYKDSIFWLSNKYLDKIFEKKYKEIIVNSLVTYNNVFEIQKIIEKYKEKNEECCIRYFVHDFHCVCPELNLIHGTEYCGLNCKKYSCQLEVRKGSQQLISIDKWRNKWSEFFECTDEVRCFSESSRNILERAYENVNFNHKISIVPHQLKVVYKEIGVNNKDIKVAFVGKINSKAKGIEKVRRMLKMIDPSIPIVFVGSDYKDVKYHADNIEYLGAYKKETLDSLISELGISIVVFPSIWPETFSYVVSELMLMKIPIISFNIGAQAEKLRKYEYGMVMENEQQIADYLNSIKKKELGKK